MMAIAILMAGLSGLVTGWLFTSAHAAAELRRKHAEWQALDVDLRADMAALLLQLSGKPVERDPRCPPGMVYLVHGKGGKTGGDAA